MVLSMGRKPKVLSRENIFTPIHSAIKAFATKNEQRTRKSFVLLCCREMCIVMLDVRT
jgi:hypothetical protein